MYVKVTGITFGLCEWLRELHDDGQPPLVLVRSRGGLRITRRDGTEVSPSEAEHVRALVAAHRVKKI